MSGGTVRGTPAAGPILPGATVGVLGSGQLGRMLAGAAAALGYQVHVYSPEPGSPAGLVAAREVVGSYDDADSIGAFAAGVDVLTFEFENLSSAAVAAAERHTVVRPGAEVLATAQNRRAEKQYLSDAGFPVAPWRPLDAVPPARAGKVAGDPPLEAGSPDAAGRAAAAGIGFPAIVKTAGFGYDGKGQRRVHDAAELAAVVQAAGEPLIVERVVPFDRELSVIGRAPPAASTATSDRSRTCTPATSWTSPALR